jgi:hypothetical protein
MQIGASSMGKKNGSTKKESAVVYWHGGAAGRAIGDQLIPGTDVPGLSEKFASITPELFDQQRPDFVHITTNRNLAFDFAISCAQTGPAVLYRVKTLNTIPIIRAVSLTGARVRLCLQWNLTS